jgi:hypothetical protein
MFIAGLFTIAKKFSNFSVHQWADRINPLVDGTYKMEYYSALNGQNYAICKNKDIPSV